MNDITLIFTPIDYKYKDADTHYAPSLGLIALENFLYNNGKSVSILDGSTIYDMNAIEDYLVKNKPKFVGQSIQLISYKNALIIAEIVHSYGGVNILGGHHASQMFNEILLNQNQLIDFITIGDGEESLLQITNSESIENIPNIAFWKNEKVNKTYSKIYNVYNPIDYSRVNLKPYQDLLKNSLFSDGEYDNYLRIYSHKGCGNRLNSNACVFCGRADQGVRFKSSKLFWDDIEHVCLDNFNNYIFDVGDDFLYSEMWVDNILKDKRDIKNSFGIGIFGRANRVTEDISKKLSKIGIVDVVIGFESGDENVMKQCNKLHSTPHQNIIAAKYLAANGIDITASYVLGLPGENITSLKNTFNNAKQVCKIISSELGRPPKEMVANLLEPSPGSPIYTGIRKQLPYKYNGKDDLDLSELQRDYFKCYFGLDTDISYKNFRNELCKCAKEIHSLVPFSDSQGWLSDEL